MSIHRLLLTLPLLCVAASSQAGQSITVSGRTYQSKGLVGVGRLAASEKDKFNETFGSFSAFTFAPGSWSKSADGVYRGTLLTQPDRGYNVDATTNYTPRFNKLSVAFSPAPAGATVQDQVRLAIQETIKFSDPAGEPFTSFDPDPTSSGKAIAGFPVLPVAHNGRLSLDAEGIAATPDGQVWVSDEYGPYIFRFDATGKLTLAVRPPEAVIPKRAGADNFASNNPPAGKAAPSPANPTTGRQNNQGLEGLSLSPDGRTLFALLQSAARQDGGTGGSGPRRYTRLFAYDVSGATPSLKAEYVVELPTYQNGSATLVPAQSEMLAISDTQFLVLARDGAGRGTATPTSRYRSILVYDLIGATNIVGTAYDTPSTPVAPGGVLAAGIQPARGQVLIDINESAELAKFNLTNGPIDSVNNLSEKWEALALVPALDPAAPDDWFLFVGNDNDFLTLNGFQADQAYAASVDNDSMILVYRLTLPSRLVNVSSRAMTSAGEGTHIAGFAVDGTKPKWMLVRAVGPALAQFGLSQTLADPALRLFNQQGQVLFENDNWDVGPSANWIKEAAARAGAFSLTAGSKDAALLVQLSPGVYTAQAFPVSTGSGVTLVEVYEVP